MSESKHTPGPWHPGHLGSDSSCQCRNVVDEGYAGGICTIHIHNGIKSIAHGGNDAPPRDEAIANMHLIAAAPDMHEALRQVEAEMKAGLGSSYGETREQIRRALAKAEGRS